MKWIPTSERLPDRDEDVLICEKRPNNPNWNDMYVMYLCETDNVWRYSDSDIQHSSSMENYYISHWAKLPEPPKTE